MLQSVMQQGPERLMVKAARRSEAQQGFVGLRSIMAAIIMHVQA